MANVLNRTTKAYLTSVNTPDYPVQDWIIDPDVSSVAGFPSYYWTITGDVVTLMSQAERDAVDAQRAADAVAQNIQANKDRFDNEDILRAVVKLMIDEVNTLRALHSLADRTAAQARTAIRNALDGGV